MRSLFATLLAIAASTSVPAIANSSNLTDNLLASRRESRLSVVSQQQQVKSLNAASPHQFAARSLKMVKHLPASTIGVMILDVDPQSWQLSADAPPIDPVLGLDKLFGLLAGDPQISIAKYVQPWLGKEMAIAFLSNPNQQTEIMFVGLAPITNTKSFDDFLTKLQESELPQPTETLYKNVKILEWQLQSEEGESDDKPVISQLAKSQISQLRTKQNVGQNMDEDLPEEDQEMEEFQPPMPDFTPKKFAIANLPSGMAVIASDRQAIEQMIDVNESQSLATHPLFLRSVNNPRWNQSLLAGYGDFQSLAEFYKSLAEDLPETSEIPGFSRAEYLQGLETTLAQYSSFDLFTWLTPKGLRSQSNSYFSSVRPPLPKDNENRDRLLSYLPPNVYGAITSRNLNRQWQWFVEESKIQPSYKIFTEGLRMVVPLMFGFGVDIDIEKDIISWMDGEYAFVVFPSENSPLKEVGTDVTAGMLIRTSKPEAANAALAKLNNFVTSLKSEGLQIKKRQVGTTLLTSFEFPDEQVRGKTQSIFAYGWRDRQTLLLTLGSSTAADFSPTPKPSLAQSEMFRDAIADMPQPNFGYFYLNANAIAKQGVGLLMLTGVIPFPDVSSESDQPQLPPPVQKAIDMLGGAVFVYSETSDRFQADFFLGLNP
ncbi:DUF3352 domain-containing protein [Pseudanabaena mucicola]|uniref:DUF3352 domain-containing protein n=1 Tax=Pseudanabaena mucicola FACHB-723 TaxID=2692860 RepID=A0ABR7ZWM5_9CYAN|nr:DUF3352 domain-containing protein [Pseudanabaena mucicola]MBD2187798.1 DUF3352 domain-containing protein [Pseudanabaena mucicola FACHB-723]